MTLRKPTQSIRYGYSLLELMLALALSAVVAGMLGIVIQNYLVNQTRGRDSVAQAQLARAVLNMIAEDIRTTVRFQPFDTSGLEQMLASDTGGGGAAAAGGQGGGVTAGAGGAASGSTGGGQPSAGSGGGASSTSGGSAASSTTETVAPLPPGIYGSSTSIEIDVSRLPRPDEYFPRIGDVALGSMGDMPSDIKTVGYYVQSPRIDGVMDPLTQLTQEQLLVGNATVSEPNGGLVRRAVDRAVTQYAYEAGQSDQLLRTGELVAPEVIALEFSYFDGATWQTQWDGSQQGLPHVVKITIAMQRDSVAKANPLAQGMSIESMTSAMMQEYGLEVYSTNTIIPGAQLLVAPQGFTTTGSASSGMNSVGL